MQSEQVGLCLSCDLCGADIKEWAHSPLWSLSSDFHGMKSEWGDAWATHGFFYGQATELETASFTLPWTWACFYRSIYSTASHESGFRISGVSILHDDINIPKIWRLPTNSDALLLGDATKSRHGYISFSMITDGHPQEGRQSDAVTAFMHERCWSLLKQVIDEDSIKREPGPFIFALCAQPWRPHNNLNQAVDEEVRMLQQATSWGYPDPWNMQPRMYKSFVRQYLNSFRCLPRAYGLRDPVMIDGLQQKLIKWQTKPKRSIETQQATLYNITSSGINIPSDIVLCILDHLPLRRDVQALVKAFPDWDSAIPPRYWKFRLFRDYNLEVDQVLTPESLDWRAIFFDIDQPFASLHGWQNRQRILRILEDIVPLFRKWLKVVEHTSRRLGREESLH